jgi:uncharacterized protein YlxP (DUF503 family)
MVVGIVRIELHIPASRSLKDKRQVVRGLKDRIRERARAAVAEVDHHDLWQRAALGVAVVAADGGQARELLQSVRGLVEHTFEAQLTDWQERYE